MNMAHTTNFRAIALPRRDQKPDRLAPPSMRDARHLVSAPNDNFSCFEQYVFERAVARELSGDVDF